MAIQWTTVKEIIEETAEIKTFLLDLPADFTWEEGAHTHFALEGFNTGEKPNKGLVRHMSISTLPTEGVIGITTRIKEQCSEFKSILKTMQVGDKVALFKTHSNMTLRRNNKNIYLLSSGVGIATFRPVVLHYLQDQTDVTSVQALNIDTSKQFLFTDVFESQADKNFTATFVDTRDAYYATVEQLAADKDGLFYIVGSDAFLKQNVELLRTAGISDEQFILDKRERGRAEILGLEVPEATY